MPGISVFQAILSVADHLTGKGVLSRETPSRCDPRHMGQSPARAQVANRKGTSDARNFGTEGLQGSGVYWLMIIGPPLIRQMGQNAVAFTANAGIVGGILALPFRRESLTRYLSSAALLWVVAAGNVCRADDGKDIQGIWKPEKIMERGREMAPEKRAKLRIEFKEGKAIIRAEGEKDRPADYTIDAAKTPRNISIKPEDKEGMIGIYKLDGDTLTICLGREARPTEFESKENVHTLLMVLKREKK